MDKTIHSPEYQCFLEVLREARRTAGVTQSVVAERLGEPQSWVSRVESGETRMTVVELVAYSRALGVSAGQIIAALEQRLARD